MMRAAIGGLIITAGVLTLTGCAPSAHPGTSLSLSPARARVVASQAAYEKAHPGLVHCTATVAAMLVESYIDMHHGGQGIPPDPSGVTIPGIRNPGLVIDTVYAQFYDALAAYVIGAIAPASKPSGPNS